MRKLINIPLMLVGASIVIAVLFIWISAQRDLTSLEGILFQAICLSLGLTGSYFFGKQSATKAAQDMIKPHATAAFRRLVALYLSLGRLATEIQKEKYKKNPPELSYLILDKFDCLVIEQIATANDSLEDWRDIIPEELAKLQKIAKGNQEEKKHE